ncbi:MAG: FG-GAP-like repeat-containing protein [Fimbriiglobus sp.]|nr:FG-GAP-like repeat-containing protein [Fimbriiglobus sp.]
MPSPAPSGRPRWVLPAALLIAVAALAVTGYILWPKPQITPRAADLDAAIARNLRGVALMEQGDTRYAEAEQEFAAAVEAAPEWLPARINLGIALFNQQPADTKELSAQVKKAQLVFADVLARDPDNRHAHYCLGMIDLYVGKYAEAHPRFRKVSEADSGDAHTWLRVGMSHPDGQFSPAAGAFYEKAIALDPYLVECRYKLFMVLRDSDPKRSEEMRMEHEMLSAADRFTESRIVYGEMGKYADVIGRDPATAGKPITAALPAFDPAAVSVTLPDGVRWATTDDLDPLRRAARERFGGVVVVFDYNTDGKPDVLLLSAVVEMGKVRDLLLRNDGDGKFVDITREVGLAGDRVSLGAAAADYDNNGSTDLAVTTANGVRLFRNGGGKFEDASTTAKLDGTKGLFLGVIWADVDLDGDLDLAACKFADAATGFPKTDGSGGVVVFENIGIAPPADPKGPPPPLSTAFKATDVFKEVFPKGPAVAILAADIDDDRDQDLVAFYDGEAPLVAFNDRLMRWHRGVLSGATDTKANWNGGLVLDANHDARSDLLLLRAGQPPLLLLSKEMREFTAKPLAAPAFLQATVTDLDLDGWPDVVGLTADQSPLLLRGSPEGGMDPVLGDVFGSRGTVTAAVAFDLTGDAVPDLLAWGQSGLQGHRNKGNGNHPLVLNPTGIRDTGSNCRTSNDGLGAWVVAQSGSHWTGAERTTGTAGLGQSMLPTLLGMGKHNKAAAVRVRWADNVIQAEVDVPTGTPYKLVETNRKGTSCPVLMAWDGEKFVFVTDFLGAGALGECGPDGSVRPPRGEESVKIEPGILKATNGEFVLKIAEPMDEVLYLDRLQLAVIDHPPTTTVYPDERFVFSGPQPTQKLLTFSSQYRPNKATDHTGVDLTERVLKRDRRAVDNFKVRSWLGYAEDHSLTLEFGELPKADRWHLVLAGWTEYPYPESMYAATRAGVTLQPPVLEQFDAKSDRWVPVCDLGFPAGLPRVMTRELPTAPTGKLRIRTNMQVYWDEVYLAPAADTTATTLDVKRADLAARGFMKEVHPDGRPPVAYDDAHTDPFVATRWKGKLTKLGDVTDLITVADDRMVLCGPGDEMTVRFDATKLPALKPGWERSFVLKSQGYCKDTSTTTVTGGQVGPLPFRSMPNYPDFSGAKPPATDADRWHTRPSRSQ